MPLVISQLKTYLYQWASANVPNGMPVIYYYQNAPRPTVDYVTLYLTNFIQIGRDWIEEPTDDTGITNQVGDREFTLQLQAYGGDPFTVLENLRTSLQKESILSSLRSNGIVYVNWFPIQDITALIDSQFEQRASMDLYFRVAQIYTDNIGVIDTVQVTETFEDPTGSIVLTQTFNIPPS